MKSSHPQTAAIVLGNTVPLSDTTTVAGNKPIAAEHVQGSAWLARRTLFASVIGTAIELFDFYAYATRIAIQAAN